MVKVPARYTKCDRRARGENLLRLGCRRVTLMRRRGGGGCCCCCGRSTTACVPVAWLAVPRTYRVVAGSADNISDVSGARCRNDAPYLSISVNAGVELSCVESGHS